MKQTHLLQTAPATFTSFDGGRCIASGPLVTVALAVAKAIRAGSNGPLLTFDDRTGAVVDMDTRGSDAQIVARLKEPTAAPHSIAPSVSTGDAPNTRGRGRPKLGVVAREVTLLPRHWEWLAAQRGGASVALRKIVDEARHAQAAQGEGRERRERSYRFMSAIAGDYPGFEEASRALFAGDRLRFIEHAGAWPGDVRQYAVSLAFGLDEQAQHQPSNPESGT